MSGHAAAGALAFAAGVWVGGRIRIGHYRRKTADPPVAQLNRFDEPVPLTW